MSDTATVIRNAAQTFSQLKASFDSSEAPLVKNEKCEDLLQVLMKSLIKFPTFLNPTAVSVTRPQEIALAREALELGVLVSCRRKDLRSMECYHSQLQVYYQDMSDASVHESERRHLLIGLNLMRLLVCSGVSQFHTELESIPKSEYSNIFIKFPIQLERFLMEGSYHKLLHARGQVPSNEYLPVVEMLEDTVRKEVSKCIPKCYPRLSVESARKMLMLQSSADVLEIGKQNAWPLSGDENTFNFGLEDVTGKKSLPFLQVLGDNVHYAAELQKVV
jgi:26S proteasome regulatory subunit N12